MISTSTETNSAALKIAIRQPSINSSSLWAGMITDIFSNLVMEYRLVDYYLAYSARVFFNFQPIVTVNRLKLRKYINYCTV
jgi:hypothetical protein